MRLKLPALIGAALFLSCGAPAVAAPGDDIGATVRIVNVVTGEYETDRRDLAKGDPVRQDEMIEVSDDGIGEIRLRDDTELALGPGARLKLDEFVYDPDVAGGAIVVNLVRGAFRFITGIAAKPAYVIRTPTAAITVRGTIFDVYVETSGVSWLLLIEGAIEVCNEDRQCNDLDEPGKLIRITPDGVVGNAVKWADLPTGDLPFATAFPFVVTPPEIDPEPELTADDIVAGNIPEGPIDADDESGPDDRDYVDDDRDEPDHGPPLVCWDGWKRVPKGWSEDGWRVKHRQRGDRFIRCAHRIEPPHDGGGGGGIVIPLPPQCSGGKTVLFKSFPPRWHCVCPDGKKRYRIGPHAFVCKGKFGGGDGGGGDNGGGGGGKNPKKECLKKGWYWIGGVCLPQFGKCKNGTVGKWPNCKKIDEPGKSCPHGTTGKWPICKKLELKPKKCPDGSFGKWPNCKKLHEKKVYQKKDKKPEDKKEDKKGNKLDDLKKAIEQFKQKQNN
jgi:FecR protein